MAKLNGEKQKKMFYKIGLKLYWSVFLRLRKKYVRSTTLER